MLRCHAPLANLRIGLRKRAIVGMVREPRGKFSDGITNYWCHPGCEGETQ